jgi:hypothetical protein
MAGTLNVTTISGVSTLNAPSGVLATQNGMTGIAKAWVNFAGSATPTINSSFNVSSVTYNSTGNYTVTFTTVMPNANYVTLGGCLESTTDGTQPTNRLVAPTRTAPLVGSVRVGCVFFDGTFQSTTAVYVAVLSS